jgi:hypothetical protein
MMGDRLEQLCRFDTHMSNGHLTVDAVNDLDRGARR